MEIEHAQRQAVAGHLDCADQEMTKRDLRVVGEDHVTARVPADDFVDAIDRWNFDRSEAGAENPEEAIPSRLHGRHGPRDVFDQRLRTPKRVGVHARGR